MGIPRMRLIPVVKVSFTSLSSLFTSDRIYGCILTLVKVEAIME